MKWLFILTISFFFSSCSLGLVAVHSEFPYLCFLKGCRREEKQAHDQKHAKAKRVHVGHEIKRKSKQKGSKATAVKRKLRHVKPKFKPSPHSRVSF